jgi:hypothetical protein
LHIFIANVREIKNAYQLFTSHFSILPVACWIPKTFARFKWYFMLEALWYLKGGGMHPVAL